MLHPFFICVASHRSLRRKCGSGHFCAMHNFFIAAMLRRDRRDILLRFPNRGRSTTGRATGSVITAS